MKAPVNIILIMYSIMMNSHVMCKMKYNPFNIIHCKDLTFMAYSDMALKFV